ncbi:MAG: aa3-type cytochrome c oxidase subunit IV [Pseudomonadota bacterium]
MADQIYEVNNENGAPMDYPEHEQTYSMFLWLTKWGVFFNIALLVAMAVGFFMGGGALGGILTFIVLMIVARILA